MNAALLCLLLAAGYHGKYEGDPRFESLVKELPQAEQRARGRVARALGEKSVQAFPVRFEDAGSDPSGRWAEVGEDGTIVLRTEYLVTGACTLDEVLPHELFHCLQRAGLKNRYDACPEWAREGAAVYVASGIGNRAFLLAAAVGRNPAIAHPLARLVNGLEGPHGLYDYVEDGCAFLAAERRCGAEKTAALLRRLLVTPDVKQAIREVLGENFETFQSGAEVAARALLRPLVENGRAGILGANRLLQEGKPAEALAAIARVPEGAYSPDASFGRALALFRLGRAGDALTEIRTGFLARFRGRSTLLDQALFLELRLLKRTGDGGFRAAGKRALRDLEPSTAYPEVLAFLKPEGFAPGRTSRSARRASGD